MRRGRLLIGLPAAILVGCLFPSFDDLKKDGVAAAPSGDDDDDGGTTTKPKDATSSSSSGSSSSGETSSSSSSGQPGDANTSSSSSGTTPPPKAITCGNKACNANEFCCKDIIGDEECRPNSASDDCDTVLRCDGAEDCGPGQSCCQNATGGSSSVCKDGPCGGDVYTFCSVTGAKCPASQPSCTGSPSIGPHTDILHCQ